LIMSKMQLHYARTGWAKNVRKSFAVISSN
jgi:hypothetical protein